MIDDFLKQLFVRNAAKSFLINNVNCFSSHHYFNNILRLRPSRQSTFSRTFGQELKTEHMSQSLGGGELDLTIFSALLNRWLAEQIRLSRDLDIQSILYNVILISQPSAFIFFFFIPATCCVCNPGIGIPLGHWPLCFAACLPDPLYGETLTPTWFPKEML